MLQARAASDNGMVSVTTSSSRQAPDRLSMAAPDSTGCVQYATTLVAPCSLSAAAAALKEQGATKVVAYCTHPVLSGAAIDNLSGACLDELVVTDTIPLSEAARACSTIRQLSVAELLAETIRRIAFGESVSSLYVD